MAKGLEVKLSDLKGTTCHVQLFNRDRYIIREGKAYRYVYVFSKGKKEMCEIQQQELEDIFPKIKLLMDKQQRVIASRASEKARLLTTKENATFRPKNRKASREETIYYALRAKKLI